MLLTLPLLPLNLLLRELGAKDRQSLALTSKSFQQRLSKTGSCLKIREEKDGQIIVYTINYRGLKYGSFFVYSKNALSKYELIQSANYVNGKRHGVCEIYKRQVKRVVQRGIPIGMLEQVTYSKGKYISVPKILLERRSYVNGYVEKVVCYHPNKQPSKFKYFNQGIPTGIWKYFYSNGILMKVCNYKDGLLDGKQIRYHQSKDPKIRSISFYRQGKKEGTETWFHSNGAKSEVKTWRNDMLEGVYKKFNPEGGLVSETFYKANLKEGFDTHYHYNKYPYWVKFVRLFSPNYRVKVRSSYSKDILCGKSFVFDSKGRLTEVFDFTHGINNYLTGDDLTCADFDFTHGINNYLTGDDSTCADFDDIEPPEFSESREKLINSDEELDFFEFGQGKY